VIAVITFCQRESFDINRIIESRPTPGKRMYDYARVTDSLHTYALWEKALDRFAAEYDIEALILIVPSIGEHDIIKLAVEVFKNWKVGAQNDGRGLLIFVSIEEQLVKIEVGYELEDLFTDHYCGYIEKRDLIRWMQNNQIAEGLVSAIDMLSLRASGEVQDNYIEQQVRSSMHSGGGGNVQKIAFTSFPKKRLLSDVERTKFKAQATPTQLFEILKKMWKEEVDDPYLEMFTPESQMFLKCLPPVTRTYCEYMYNKLNQDYVVIEKDGYAVVILPNDPKAAAFLLKQSNDGWQVDVISMIYWLKETFNGDPYIMGDDHPYVFAFENTEYSYMLADYDYCDHYGKFSNINSDYQFQIDSMISIIKQHPDDYRTRINLGELYFDLAIIPYAVSVLEEARVLSPQTARIYLLLGLLMRDFYYFNDAAEEHFKKYISMKPHDGDGYLHLSITYWRKATEDGRFYKNAAETILKYGKITGNYLYSYQQALLLYYHGGDYERAKKVAKKILDIEPNNNFARKIMN
jgi:uncharacterized protein